MQEDDDAAGFNLHNDKKAMHKEKMNLFCDLLKEMKD
jgi:hypothetical protein